MNITVVTKLEESMAGVPVAGLYDARQIALPSAVANELLHHIVAYDGGYYFVNKIASSYEFSHVSLGIIEMTRVRGVGTV